MQKGVTQTENSVSPFEHYINSCSINPMTVAVLANVRFVSVWNMMKGVPISRQKAYNIVSAARKLSGKTYTGKIALLDQIPIENITTQEIPVSHFD